MNEMSCKPDIAVGINQSTEQLVDGDSFHTAAGQQTDFRSVHFVGEPDVLPIDCQQESLKDKAYNNQSKEQYYYDTYYGMNQTKSLNYHLNLFNQKQIIERVIDLKEYENKKIYNQQTFKIFSDIFELNVGTYKYKRNEL